MFLYVHILLCIHAIQNLVSLKFRGLGFHTFPKIGGCTIVLMRLIVGFKGVGFRVLHWILFIIFVLRDNSIGDCWRFQAIQS